MNRLGYFLREGVRSVFTHRLSSGLTIIIILACLLIMGSCGLLAYNVDYMIENLELQNPILAFVDENIKQRDIQNLEKQLSETDHISRVEYVTRAEAMESFLARLQDSSLFDDIDESVFRNRFVLYLDDIQYMAKTQKDIESIPGIAKVNAHLGISRGFITVRRTIMTVSVGMGALLLFVCMAMMTSALRVTTYDRRNEVAIVKMIGASKAFIRIPLTIEGTILGLVGAIIAFLIESTVYDLALTGLADSNLSFLNAVPFERISFALLIAYAAVGYISAVIGSRIAIRNYIKN